MEAGKFFIQLSFNKQLNKRFKNIIVKYFRQRTGLVQSSDFQLANFELNSFQDEIQDTGGFIEHFKIPGTSL